MKIEQFDLSELDSTSQLIKDYISQKEELIQLVGSRPSFDYLKHKMTIGRPQPIDRKGLVSEILSQYDSGSMKRAVQNNLDLLEQEHSFTVCTAHQPSLFTGPFYVIIKALSTIALSNLLNEKTSKKQVVPVFVLGGEDHDFEEINHLNLFNKRIEWNYPEASGPVGMMSCEGIEDCIDELATILGGSDLAKEAVEEIRSAFDGAENYGEGVRKYLNTLFGHLGLVVVSLSTPYFKRQFSRVIKDELIHKSSQARVERQLEKLDKLGDKKQAHPREINLFHIEKGLRERIIFEEGRYKVNNTELSYAEEELLAEVDNHPEKFSPNVILRPVLQELCLPNLAFVGGGGELAYWMQLPKVFEHHNVPFPCLLRRDSMLWIPSSSMNKIDKLGLSVCDVFLDTNEIIKKYILNGDENGSPLSSYKKELSELYARMRDNVSDVDKTLGASVMVEMKNSMKGVASLEGKINRALKLKSEVQIRQIEKVKDQLFPKGKLQERVDNFLPTYIKHGKRTFDILLGLFNPLKARLTVVMETD